jgi:putative oxygen-independent coproporphyrinogen III oxidase
LHRFIYPPPLSLYIHLPWCVKKCPYCDFNSHATGDGNSFPEQAYIDALLRDLEFELPRIASRQIVSIFIGGGTPSLFSAEALQRLLETLHERLLFSPPIEITLEANPGTVEALRFQAYRQIGINRLSIGVQSFNDVMLKHLGRIHTASTAVDAITIAKAAGFERINIDLMYGLPNQSIEQAIADLEQGITLTSAHLSWYQLTIEPNTVFYKNTPVLPEQDQIWDMQEAGQTLLSSAGLEQYEISAYAKPGQRCLHNLNYWEFGDYVGLGAGAHGKLTDISTNTVTRYARHRIPERYLQLAGQDEVIADTRTLQQQDLILEFMMNTLRLTGGIQQSLFTERTGLPLHLIETMLISARDKGWLEGINSRIIPTTTGRNYLNDLLQCFNS